MAPGGKFEELTLLVCECFDLEDLRHLVKFKLNRSLDGFVNDGKPLSDVAFDLIDYFDKRGELDDFIRVVYLERDKKPEVVKFCRQYAPFLLKNASDSAAAESARQGLDILVNKQTKPAVADALRSIRAEVQATHNGIHRLNTYKQLHDLFHEIDFQILRVLEKAARGFSQDPTNDAEFLDLKDYTEDLDQKVSRARSLTEKLPSDDQQGLLNWIEKLERASKRLNSVVKTHSGDPEGPVRSLIRPTLAQVPELVHTRLSDETRRLPLRKLIDTVSSLAEEKAINGSSQALRECLDGLRQLDARLRELVNEHSLWQKIDDSVRLIDTTMTTRSTNSADWHDDLRLQTENLQEECLGVAGASELISTIDEIKQKIDEIKQKLATDAQRQLQRLVDRLSRQARGQFFYVDDKLLKFCGELISVNGKFEQLAITA